MDKIVWGRSSELLWSETQFKRLGLYAQNKKNKNRHLKQEIALACIMVSAVNYADDLRTQKMVSSDVY